MAMKVIFAQDLPCASVEIKETSEEIENYYFLINTWYKADYNGEKFCYIEIEDEELIKRLHKSAWQEDYVKEKSDDK